MIFRKRMVFEINGLANEELKMRKGLILNRIFSFLTYWAEGVATKYSDRVIAVTPQIALYLEDHFDCPKGKIEVISNGVNTEVFYPIRNRNMVLSKREKHGIKEEEMVLTFVGNLAPWQGVEDLIHVAPLLLEYMKNIRFLIVGDGILKKDFEAEVEQLQLSPYFIFTGMVSYNEIPLYINISDVCVILKRRLISGYSPIKLYEYMACGKPIVATRVGGFEFIEKEGIGQLIEPRDIVNLCEVLRDFLKNPHKRIVMGLKSQQIAKERFSWDSRVNRIEKILKELA
jgi:glycosyltransferase involved in cell wall biosynthesis